MCLNRNKVGLGIRKLSYLNRPSRVLWKASKEGIYVVKSNKDMLEGGRGAVSFPKKLVWNQRNTTKVGFLFGNLSGVR